MEWGIEIRNHSIISIILGTIWVICCFSQVFSSSPRQALETSNVVGEMYVSDRLRMASANMCVYIYIYVCLLFGNVYQPLDLSLAHTLKRLLAGSNLFAVDQTTKSHTDAVICNVCTINPNSLVSRYLIRNPLETESESILDRFQCNPNSKYLWLKSKTVYIIPDWRPWFGCHKFFRFDRSLILTTKAPIFSAAAEASWGELASSQGVTGMP